MAIKPVPNRCIWCLKEPPSAAFTTKSHVLPKSIGNIKQQVLPPGIVCDDCNQSFSHDLEPNLIDEPILSTLVAILGVRDPHSQFIYSRSPSGIHRNVHLETEISPNRITLTTRYEIRGQPNKPNEVRLITKTKDYDQRGQPNKPNEVRLITKTKDYDQRALAFLSRAVHKIAFETVAHNEFVGTGIEYKNKGLGYRDVFHPNFNVIRDWVRWGQPQKPVRPTLRNERFDEVKTMKQLIQFGGETHYFQHGIYYGLNLYNDWYFMSLTSSPDKVKDNLISWVQTQKFRNPVWMVGDKLQIID